MGGVFLLSEFYGGIDFQELQNFQERGLLKKKKNFNDDVCGLFPQIFSICCRQGDFHIYPFGNFLPNTPWSKRKAMVKLREA